MSSAPKGQTLSSRGCNPRKCSNVVIPSEARNLALSPSSTDQSEIPLPQGGIVMTDQKRMLGMDKLIERYLNYLRYERNASPHTVRNYRSDLLQFRDYLAEGRAAARGRPKASPCARR